MSVYVTICYKKSRCLIFNLNIQKKQQSSFDELNSAIKDCLDIYSKKDYSEIFREAKSKIVKTFKIHLYNLLLDSNSTSLDILNEGIKVEEQLPQDKKFKKLKETISCICQNTFGRVAPQSCIETIDCNYVNRIPVKENKTGKLGCPVLAKVLLLEQIYKTNIEKAFNFSLAFLAFDDKTNREALEKSLTFFLEKDPELALKLAQRSLDKQSKQGSSIAKKAYSEFLKSDPHKAEILLKYCQTKTQDEKACKFYERLVRGFVHLSKNLK